MKTYLVKLGSLLFSLVFCLQADFSITVLANSSSLNQNQGQDQGRNQQVLPPGKKKSLSTLGPEDVFPVTPEQVDIRSQSNRPAPSPSPTAYISRTSRPPASTARTSPKQKKLIAAPDTNIATPDTNVEAAPASPAPTSTIPETSLRQQAQPPSPDWLLPSLLILTLLVFTAFILVIYKLMEKLREGSG